MSLELINRVDTILKMGFEHNRLDTFKSWKFGDKSSCSARKLAEAGFYFTGTVEEPDAVQCFLCDKALDGWDEHDDPWKEHISHSKDCAFAKLKLSEQNLNFQQLYQFNHDLTMKHVKECVTKIEELHKKGRNQRCTLLKKSLKKF